MKVEFRGLTKSYGNKKVLDSVTFTLEQGVYGLLGPNGAGKSTLMNLLTGNIKADQGEIIIDGKMVDENDRSWCRKIGYMPQIQTFYPEFTGEEFMFYIASLKDMKQRTAVKQIRRILKYLELYDVRKQKIKTYSGGMRQRLLFGQSLLNDPSLLILDEPTAGMDPKQRVVLSRMIGELSLNRTILISTHVVSDIEHIAKEIILLKSGTILEKCDCTELFQKLTNKVFEVQLKENHMNDFENDSKKTVIGFAKDADGVRARIIREEIPYYSVKQVPPSLEDVYMYYFGDEDHAF